MHVWKSRDFMNANGAIPSNFNRQFPHTVVSLHCYVPLSPFGNRRAQKINETENGIIQENITSCIQVMVFHMQNVEETTSLWTLNIIIQLIMPNI